MTKFSFTIIIFTLITLSIAFDSHAQGANYARKVVGILSSSKYQGRGYVADGLNKAADFIAGEYKKFGLKPPGDGSFFSSYKLDVNTFPATVYVGLDGKELKTGVDYLVNASSPSVDGEFFVYAITRTQLADPSAVYTITEKAIGKYLMLDDRASDKETPEEAGVINHNILRLQYDDRISLKGLIIFTNEKLTWTAATDQSIRPVITINNRNIDPSGVRKINLKVDARLLRDYTARNVTGIVKGTQVPDSMLVITAHYDHLGTLGNGVYFPGANDNASGIALMLSVARYYSKHPGKYTMVFIAFSGEELGLLGSKAFVNNPSIDLGKIKFLMNFDIAGTGDEGIKVVNGSVYRDEFDRLVRLNHKNRLLSKVEIRGEACNSDHCSFYERGIPSFFIYTQGGIKAYHDVYDKAETLPLTAFAQYFKLMQLFFDEL